MEVGLGEIFQKPKWFCFLPFSFGGGSTTRGLQIIKKKEKHALTGIGLAVHKNKQKHPVGLLISWCVSIKNGLSCMS